MGLWGPLLRREQVSFPGVGSCFVQICPCVRLIYKHLQVHLGVAPEVGVEEESEGCRLRAP